MRKIIKVDRVQDHAEPPPVVKQALDRRGWREAIGAAAAREASDRHRGDIATNA